MKQISLSIFTGFFCVSSLFANTSSDDDLKNLEKTLSKGEFNIDQEIQNPANSTNRYQYTYRTKTGHLIITNRVSNDSTYELVQVKKYKPTQENSFTNSELNLKLPNIEKYYEPIQLNSDQKMKLEYLSKGEKVVIGELAPDETATKSLSERGYIVIGFSHFKDREISKNSIENQAKKVGATIVTFSKINTSFVSYTKSDNPNNLDYIYNYKVTFYAKQKMNNNNILGIMFSDIPIDKRSLFQRNTGVYVETVIKNTKAYDANILSGDVIIEINDIPVTRIENFNLIKDDALNKNKTLRFKIIRLINNNLNEFVIPVKF